MGAVDVVGDDLLRGAVIADCGEAVRVRRPPTAACGGTSPTSVDGARDESVTNEPERDEEVKSSNHITNIGITTNSDVDSGLDKSEVDSNFDGGETADDAECGEAFGPPRPPAVGGETPGDGDRRLGGAEATRSVGEAAPTQSVGARGVEKSSSEKGETFRARRPPTAACGGTSPTGGEGMTNEPERDEEVKSSNYITHIGITTNSCVDSGLDKGEIDGDFDGGETECGEAFRVCRPPTAACGGTSPTRGEEDGDGGRRLGGAVARRSVGEAAPTQSVGSRGIAEVEPPREVRHCGRLGPRPPGPAVTRLTGGRRGKTRVRTPEPLTTTNAARPSALAPPPPTAVTRPLRVGRLRKPNCGSCRRNWRSRL